MKIKFNRECVVEVVLRYDEELNEPVIVNQWVTPDQEFDVEIIETDNPEIVDIKFSDGSVSFGVYTIYFDKLG